jgi:putative ABC transport system permease protein
MNSLRQIFIVTALNLRSLYGRIWQSSVIVVGMACVVGVLLSMLSLTEGMHRAYLTTGDPRRAIVVSSGADSEGNSTISRAIAPIIEDAPGIAKDESGRPISDRGIVMPISGNNRIDGSMRTIILRGFGPGGLKLRPDFKIFAGRMFRSGSRELITGVGAQGQFSGLAVGDKVILPDGEWPVVGTFTSGRDILEGEVIGDTDTLMTATRHTSYNSVVVRLTSPDAFGTFKSALTNNPALSVSVERQTEWYRKISADFSKFFTSVAYAVGLILGIGALFGALNTMYGAVDNRAREIATLRALGFGAVPVAVSVVIEAVVLSVAGAIIGAAVAWALYDGQQSSLGVDVFHLSVSLDLLGLGMLWAIVIAMLGGIPPALQSACRPVAEALRAT